MGHPGEGSRDRYLGISNWMEEANFFQSQEREHSDIILLFVKLK